jgi:hypothetical protein
MVCKKYTEHSNKAEQNKTKEAPKRATNHTSGKFYTKLTTFFFQ